MFKRFLIIVAGLLFIIPAYAQDLPDEEMAYLGIVEAAIEMTFNVDTFSLEGEQVIEQLITSEGVELEQIITQIMQGDFINQESAQDGYLRMQQLLTQASAGVDVEVDLTQEMLFIDDTLFIQFSNISPAMIENLYPAEWVLFEDAVDDYEGLALINADQMLSLMDAEQLTIPFSDLTALITDVEQLDSQQIDEQMMDVYQTRLDASLLFTDDYMDNITSLFDFSSLGIDALSVRVEDGAFVRYVYYIGHDDGFIYRTESEVIFEMTMDGATMGLSSDVLLDQTLNQTFNYSGFGEDVTLPTIED